MAANSFEREETVGVGKGTGHAGSAGEVCDIRETPLGLATGKKGGSEHNCASCSRPHPAVVKGLQHPAAGPVEN